MSNSKSCRQIEVIFTLMNLSDVRIDVTYGMREFMSKETKRSEILGQVVGRG